MLKSMFNVVNPDMIVEKLGAINRLSATNQKETNNEKELFQR